jgi:hypothetical protein
MDEQEHLVVDQDADLVLLDPLGLDEELDDSSLN